MKKPADFARSFEALWLKGKKNTNLITVEHHDKIRFTGTALVKISQTAGLYT